MRITRLRGTDILAQFRSGDEIAQFPVLLLLLVPDLSEDELRLLVQKSRVIDRMTGSLVLVVLFSKAPDNGSHPRFHEARMRRRMLEGYTTEADRKSLSRGFIDEATSLATILEIPLSNLPCIVIIDNPHSSQFYTLPYKGVKEFDILSRSTVDYIRKEFPGFAHLRDRQRQLEDTLKHANDRPTRRQRKAASKHPNCLAVLDRTLARLPNDNSHDCDCAYRYLQYLKNNPADYSAMKKLESILERLRIPSPAEELRNVWMLQAEIEAFGSPLKELKQELLRTRAELAQLPRPELAGLLSRITKREMARNAKSSLCRWITGGTTVLERVMELAHLIGSIF